MNGQTIRILLVEDNLGDARLLREALNEVALSRYDLHHAVRLDEALRRLLGETFDVVMLDLSLPDSYGIDTISRTREASNEVPIVVLTGFNDEVFAIEAVHRGAQDYLVKGQISAVLIERSIRHAIERHRVERELRLSEKRFRALIENSSDAIALVDAEGRFLYNGPSTARVLGYSSDELHGRNSFELLHPEDREGVQGLFEGLLRSPGSSASSQFRYRHQNGSWRWFEASAKNLLDEPAVRAIVANYRDITERKRAEEEIEKLAKLAKFNPDPILELTASGELAFFNEAARTMAHSLGKDHPSEVLPPNTPAIVRDCLRSGDTKSGLQTRMGERLLLWSFLPVQSAGVVHTYASDITERVNLENQLRHAQKMEAVGQLAAGVAHDFNNLLTVILGHVGLLQRQAPDAKTAESLDQVAQVSERAANLTRQLLMFSRKQIMQPKVVDLNEIIRHLAQMLRRLIGEDVRLELDYGDDLPAVRADVGMIEQVVLNLAVNARDAMPDGGTLLVRTELTRWTPEDVRVDPQARAGSCVSLSVGDTGCGMDPATQRRIFEPFFTTKGVGKGTGLGLATVYGIVKQHDGWIQVLSEIGKGSTFKVHLPAQATKAELASVAPPDLARCGSETILIVEDEPLVRGLAISILREFGYTVFAAANGKDALQLWERHGHDVDLLLTDLIMPEGVSGRALAETLQIRKPGLKVLFSSGYSAEVLGKDLQLRDKFYFLPKPYQPEKLAHAVRDCLDRRTAA